MNAIETTQHALRFGRLDYTIHVRDRMRERSATRADVESAIRTAKREVLRDNGTYRLIGGIDCTGDTLDVVVDLRHPPAAIIVTVQNCADDSGIHRAPVAQRPIARRGAA